MAQVVKSFLVEIVEKTRLFFIYNTVVVEDLETQRATISVPTVLTHWGRVTHKLTSIGSDNGLSPGRCQAIFWTNNGTLLIGPLDTNVSEILIDIDDNAFENVMCKMAATLCATPCYIEPCCNWFRQQYIRSVIQKLSLIPLHRGPR